VSRVLLTPVGSAGDVNPFVRLGQALHTRGHDVVLVAPAPFAEAAARAGIAFAASGTIEEFERVTDNPDLWHPRKGLQVVLSTVAAYLRRSYEQLDGLFEAGHTILVGHSLAFATRVFEETHHAPAATVHLAPSLFRSTIEPPATPLGPVLPMLPPWLQRALWHSLDRLAIDPLIARPLNEWRAELGLPPVSRVFQDWIHSPRRVLALFPGWFAAPQPDWPPQVRLCGFILDQGAGGRALDPDIETFLQAGSPPVVFTPGSANRQAAAFLHAAVGAAGRLGVRALLVTPYREQVPSDLPADVKHVAYAPFHQLFPRAAAVAHHGGIGSCAQGFAAGVPQVLMPMGFDQPDNATRVARLGTGAWLSPRRFTAGGVASVLERLLTDATVAAACRDLADRMREARSVERACEALEKLI
jgi:rhamnosyltransferase subunit B